MWKHEAWAVSLTWLGLCHYNPDFVNTKWIDSDMFHIASFLFLYILFSFTNRQDIVFFSSGARTGLRPELMEAEVWGDRKRRLCETLWDMWCPTQDKTSHVVTQTNITRVKTNHECDRRKRLAAQRRAPSVVLCFNALVSSLKAHKWTLCPWFVRP